MQRKHQKNAKPLIQMKKVSNSMRLKPVLPLSPEVEALERRMTADLKKRKLDLEDRLYDKVQELKEICKQEYNITEKFPIEYLRYLLPGEERPILKKKIGASFPVQLRLHTGRGGRHDHEASNELMKLESECDLMNQITKAAHQLANDPSSKGRTKKKRLQSYQKSLKKLQDIENRIDELRKRQGQDSAFRQSTLIMTNDLDIATAMRECSIDDKSERSSLSDAIMLDDETSISSGAEALSTHSTPALPLRPHSGSADVDVESIPMQRSRTPPPVKTKVAWLDSPSVKMKRNDGMTSNHSYPVLPSPASYRSATSHSSGIDDTSLHRGNSRDCDYGWDRPKRHGGWKMSSVDSLDSIESRKSSDHDLNNPEKQKGPNGAIPNANALRIVRAAESRAKKLNRQEKPRGVEPFRPLGAANPVQEIVHGAVLGHGEDSRTSLTDSGHGTDSRVQSCHEEEVGGRKNCGNEISDSSLSELSTQSNPVVLPTSSDGSLPKFVPYFMTMNSRRAKRDRQIPASETRKQNDPNIYHVRKRSSSFTELESTLQRPRSKKDDARTPVRSMTQEDKTSLSADVGKSRRPVKEMQLPIVFDSNSNICKQYRSQSQGQLAQGNAAPLQTPPPDKEVTSGMPYVSVVDKHPGTSNPANAQRPVYSASSNNSNNKLNFGQIYKMSQARATQDYSRRHYQNNESTNGGAAAKIVSKCNSLDSVLDCSHDPATTKNHFLQEHPVCNPPARYPKFRSPRKQLPSRPASPRDAAKDRGVTNCDRDKYNNEAFVEIRGMSWVPSLDEYGSRASVAESLPAESKRQDIRDMLQQHFAHRRAKRSTSSSSTSATRSKQDRRMQARIRAEMVKGKDSQTYGDGVPKSVSAGKDEENCERSLTSKRNRNGTPQKMTTVKTERKGVNLFAHKPPPPLPQQKQGSGVTTRETAGSYSSGTIHKGYVSRNGYDTQMSNMDPGPTCASLQERNIDYGEIESQKSIQNYPSYPVPASFERTFLTATLPHKYKWQEKPNQKAHRKNGPITAHAYCLPHSAGNFPHTYSGPGGDLAQDSHFYPPAKYLQRHRPHQSTDFLSAPTQSFTSPTHSFPAMDEAMRQPVNQTMRQQKSIQIPRQDQANYHRQGKIQQSQSCDTLRSACNDASRRNPESDNEAMVIQVTRTSPNGHKVSVFTVKSAPSTPAPSRNEPGDVNGGKFFGTDFDNLEEEISINSTQSKEQLLSGTNVSIDGQFDTGILQPLLTEAPSVIRNPITSSQGSLNQFATPKNPPPLPSVGPNATMRSSSRNRRAHGKPVLTSTPVKKTGRADEPMGRKADGSSTRRIPVAEKTIPKFRSNAGRGLESNIRRSASPNRYNYNAASIPVRDLRSGGKTPKFSERSSSPTPATSRFQRTLSIPSRVKPATLRQNAASSGPPQNNRNSGMHKESIPGANAELRPPAAPRATATTSIPSKSFLKVTPAEQRHLATPRATHQIRQSGTLPRNPKQHKRIERSGSTSAAVYQASRISRAAASQPQSEPRISYGRSHIPAPRKDIRNALNNSEDHKYKRSLSETWKQQQQQHTAVGIQAPDQRRYQHRRNMYHPSGHHGVTLDRPRRTASADDLLWPAPDGKNQNANLNISAQQGTLV